MSRVGIEYALVRVTPRIERGESVNVGVIVYAQTSGYLALATHVDAGRLAALDPSVDVDAVRASLEATAAVCAGGVDGGAASELSAGQRFRWLTAPRSTIVHTGPVHTGLVDDPAAETARLLERLVLTGSGDGRG